MLEAFLCKDLRCYPRISWISLPVKTAGNSHAFYFSVDTEARPARGRSPPASTRRGGVFVILCLWKWEGARRQTGSDLPGFWGDVRVASAAVDQPRNVPSWLWHKWSACTLAGMFAAFHPNTLRNWLCGKSSVCCTAPQMLSPKCSVG